MDARAALSDRRVSRPALAVRVAEALGRGALLLVAGAGFGKTTALDDGIRTADLSAVWLSCGAADEVAGTLLVRMLKGISRTVPGAVDTFLERLALAPEQIEVAALVQEVVEELDRLLVTPLVIVFDDAEHLAGAPESLRLISALIGTHGRRVRPAVASRRALPLRLARLRAAGYLTELGPGDLAFDAGECAALLRASRGTDPEPEEVEAVMLRTEGWPLGVALSAAAPMSAGDRSDVQRIVALHAYFTEEVLDPLDPRLRAAALDSSVPRRLTAKLAAALDLPSQLLGASEHAWLFLRRAADGDDALVYHPLFREFLLQRLEVERDVEQLSALRARVGELVWAEGEQLEAIELWVAAGAWEQVLTALEREGPGLTRTAPDLLESWVAQLPAVWRDHPTVQVLEGQLAWGAGDYERSNQMLRAAIAGFAQRGNSLPEWLARYTLVASLVSLGDFDSALEVVAPLDSDSALHGGPLAPGTAFALAYAMALSGRSEESESLACRALAHPDAGLIPYAEGIRCAFLAWPAGRLDEAFDRLIAAAEAVRLIDPMRGWTYVMGIRAIMYMQVGLWTEALEVWDQVVEVARGGLAPMLADSAIAWRALVYAHLGDLREAEAQLSQFRGLERGWTSHQGHVPRAVLASLRGDAREARAWAERALATVPESVLQFRTWAVLDLVPVLVRIGALPRASHLLEQTLRLVDGAFPGQSGCLHRAHLLALGAWLASERGDLEQSDRALVEFWGQAGDSRPGVLRREWPRIEPLVWRAIENGLLDAPDVMSAVGDAFPNGQQHVRFLSHPAPRAREAAIRPAVASGDPHALTMLEQLAADPDPTVAELAGRSRKHLASLTAPLSIRLLGGFAVGRGSWRAGDADWGRPTAARLVRFLAVRAGELMPEDEIHEALWPALAPDGARRSLHVATSRARRVLDLPGASTSVIETVRGCYRLVVGAGAIIDADEFSAAAAAALSEAGSARYELLERARRRWSGEPLPEERYADWATSWRERLLNQHINVLGALLDLEIQRGHLDRAIDRGLDLVDVDPVNEAAHAALISAYSRSGRRGDALRQCLVCRRALLDQLGLEPSQRIADLQAQVLSGTLS